MSAVAAVEGIIVVAFLLSSIKVLRKYERGFIVWLCRDLAGPKVPESSWIMPKVVWPGGAPLGDASVRIPKRSSPEMSTCLDHKPMRF
jgi:hypothetical protein